MWFFRSPEIVYGNDSLSYLSSLEIKRVVIITDRYLKDSELIQYVIDNLPTSSEKLVLGKVSAEPKLSEITSQLDEVRKFKPDWFIGVGGGSSIDTAKILFALYEREDITVYDITPLVKLNLRKKSRLIAIPTTSGTGSECSWAAVFSEDAEKRKSELASKEIIPDVAILDTRMVLNLPPEQTRNTAVDAITHSVESYVSTWRNYFSDALAEKSLELILKNIERVLADPRNEEAREIVHIGASMAGLSFSNSQIGLAHALGHALGAVFNLPHGKCVGLFLPYVIEFNYDKCSDRYERLNSIFPHKYREEHLHDSVKKLFDSIGQPTKLSQTSLNPDEYKSNIEMLAELAMESTGVTTNPRDATTDEIKEILQNLLK